jgi:tRNA-Thr(GGU) m(6)t(6)A37 methyltransferase TsaA
MQPVLAFAGVAVALASIAVCLTLRSLAEENEDLRSRLQDLKEPPAKKATTKEAVRNEKARPAVNNAESSPMGYFSCAPIGFVSSCFEDCQGTPRQPALAPAARAVLLLRKDISPTTLDGLADHSHVWVVFLFHKNNNGSKIEMQKSKGYTFRSKIKPPRSPKKVGCLATRTPHRPNPIGLTLARIHEVRMHVSGTGAQVLVSGTDLVDGSPILDIKPYLPAYDSPEVRKDGPSRVASWSEERSFTTRTVTFATEVVSDLSREQEESSQGPCVGSALRMYSGEPHQAIAAIAQVLAADVSRRSKVRADGSLHRYRMRFDGLVVEYTLEGPDCRTHVLSVRVRERQAEGPEKDLAPPTELKPTRKWRWSRKGEKTEGATELGATAAGLGATAAGLAPAVVLQQPSLLLQREEAPMLPNGHHCYKPVSRRRVDAPTTASTPRAPTTTSGAPLCPVAFREQYLSLCKPVLLEGALEISGSDGSSDGSSNGGWRQCVEHGWDVPALRRRFGDRSVVVRRDAASDNYRLGVHTPLERMRFDRYCDIMMAGHSAEGGPTHPNYYLAAQNLRHAFPELRDELCLGVAPAPSATSTAPPCGCSANGAECSLGQRIIPALLRLNGRIHSGPFLWLAPAGHYEFMHFDPDDGMLILLTGRKRVRLFPAASPMDAMSPNPLGADGRTVQSSVDLELPVHEMQTRFPHFVRRRGEDVGGGVGEDVQSREEREEGQERLEGGSVLESGMEVLMEAGDMLYIPCFWWHQVSSLQPSVSVNVFWGDAPSNRAPTRCPSPSPFADKVINFCAPSFFFWVTNIIEQNRAVSNFPFQRLLSTFDAAVAAFLRTQWAAEPLDLQRHLLPLRRFVLAHLRATCIGGSSNKLTEGLSYMEQELDRYECTPYAHDGLQGKQAANGTSVAPPRLKIRGLRNRGGVFDEDKAQMSQRQSQRRQQVGKAAGASTTGA